MLTIPAYDVLIAVGPPAELLEARLEVWHADQLHTEQAAPRYGLHDRKAQPMEFMTMLAWSAARRVGVFTDDYPAWREALRYIEPVNSTDPDPEARGVVEVDPTTPATGAEAPSP